MLTTGPLPVARWVVPVDPECPEVISMIEGLYGEGSMSTGVEDEIQDDWEKRHMRDCRRCQVYGAENIGVE